MKKFSIIVALLFCVLSLQAESYGILVNGTTYYAADYRGKDDNTGQYDEYLAHVPFQAGDRFQLCNAVAREVWAVNLDTYSVKGFTRDGDHYNVSVTGCFDCYIKLKYGEDQLYIGNGSGCGEGEDYAHVYTGSVPYQCEAVLMQAFFNESYKPDAPGVDRFGDTRWSTLLPQAAEIGQYFDYVWLPPSANGDGMGYHPKQYSNQNSNWGTRYELEQLIEALHNAGAKVVADIVINHCAGWTSWCDFPEMDFGEFGTFYPDASYICVNDEVNADWNKESAGSCWGKASGSYDDGENWDGARDWSHDKVYVQEMFKAYLKWMRKVMKYDGFRYDKGDGFNNWHHDNYNKAAKPEIAFMESYNGDDRIISEIEQANRNLMALDFQTKWQAFDAIAGFNYSKCQGSGLLGRGYAKYAVTFIESHDWFMRPDNENEFGGRNKSMTEELKDRLLQANAFLLGMPGVPCVFYPHWYQYKEALKPMIEARKLAGVHSESPVSDESVDENGYQCTVKGKYGWLILQLGNRTTHTSEGDFWWLSDYKLVAKGPGYAMWVNRTEPIITTDIEQSYEESYRPSATKTLRDGHIVIERDGKMFSIIGERLR